MRTKKIGIVGGGLAGLSLSILLQRKGYEVTVFERKTYPFHRVCGEYISNEIRDLIKHIGVDIDQTDHAEIKKLRISDTRGKVLNADLDLGAFGISRFELDNLLYKQALKEGITVHVACKVNDISFDSTEENFVVQYAGHEEQFDYVVASYGKRTTLDANLSRPFIKARSPYLAVKYHVRLPFPEDVIQLDNFEGGYCGLSKIEADRYCMCYLSHRDNLRKYKSVSEMEREVLFKNSEIRKHFESSEFLYDEPLVINEISFEKKELVKDHVLFCGDSAGMITPLCGNGMSMAVHAAYILAGSFPYANQEIARAQLERNYEMQWDATFAERLWWGRTIQKFFGAAALTNSTLAVLKVAKPFQRKLISLTHGSPVIIQSN